MLLGAIGVGAIAGSFALNWLKARLGPDRLVALGTLGTAFALVLFGFAREPVDCDLRLPRSPALRGPWC